MPRSDADRNLLFGFLALQMDLVTREGLIAALSAWVVDKAQDVGSILLDQGALGPEELGLLRGLVAVHLRKHGGDAEKSLAALDPLGAKTREFEQVADPEVRAGLHRVGSASTEVDPHRTADYIPEIPREAGRFRVLRPHRRGGLGSISIALDSELNREVALKEILDEHVDNPRSRSRFLLEAEVTGGLEHPGIVPVYGLGSHPDGRPYYAMKLIRGESLKDAIARHHGPAEADRPLAFRKLLRRFLGVCDAIDYAHSQGVLHRDIKPANIMLGPHGETLVVDWGLAKRVGRGDPLAEGDGPDVGPGPRPKVDRGEQATIPGRAVGTPHYMSPEQARGDLDRLGPASDVYSLGATLYCLLTGRSPFDDPSRSEDTDSVLLRVKSGDFVPPRSARPSVPAGLEAVCLKAMALEPGARHASARDLADEIERWLAEEPVSAYREAVARSESLIEQAPDRVSHREGLARSRSDLALALQVLGRGLEAAELQRGAIDEYRALVRDHPRVTGYRDGLANGYSTLGRILMALGLEAEAKDAYRAAFAEYERLVRSAPRALDYRTNLGDLMISLGRSADDVQRTIGRLLRPDLDGESTEDRSLDTPDLSGPVPSPPATPAHEDPPSSPIDAAALDDSDPKTLPEDPSGESRSGATRGLRDAELEFGFRYEVRRLVGRGGLGKVWLVHDHELHRDIVLKDLQNDQPESRRWFLLEAQITAQLTHPGIVPVYDLGRSQSGRPFYTMKFVEGDPLLELIRRLHDSRAGDRAPDPLELRRGLLALLQACNTISYAHSRGVMHRDIKPSNILLGKFGEVFVSDWGLAKVDGRGKEASGDDPRLEPADEMTTMAGTVMGTPAYMSPEQVMGDQSRIDARTDIYSLGASLFHILTGRPPRQTSRGLSNLFEEVMSGKVPRASESAPWVTPALDAICTRAMAFAPEDRYPTPEDLAEDLRRWLDGELALEVPWYRRLGRKGIGGRRGPLAP